LWVDTDTRDLGARGEPLDEIFRAVQFEKDEKFALLEGTVGKDLNDVFKNRERYEHIHEWLYPEVERYGLEIGDGAGGIRAIGRLTFFHKYSGLREAIQNAWNKLRTHEKVRETEKFFQEHKLGLASFGDSLNPMVVIVCSLAGGTGCGTLVDVAFLLRNLGVGAQIAYVFLPNVYYNSTATQMGQRSYGNAYAALKELDFYALRLRQRLTGEKEKKEKDELVIDYVVRWTAYDRPLKIPGPPFSAMYLLEMQNEAELKLEEKNRGDLFSVLAESLFLDTLPGAFPNAKRSNYSNIVSDLSEAQHVEMRIKEVPFPQRFARRYATCGLSKIEIPVDAIRGACAAELGSEILGYILRESGETNVKDDVRNEMASSRLDAEGLKDRFGTYWKDEIRKATGTVFRGRVVADLAAVDELEKELKGLEEKLVRSEGSDRLKWGVVVDALRLKTSAVTEEAKVSFSEWVSGCLENEARGLKALLRGGGYLDQFVYSLRSLYSPPEEGVKAEYDAQLESFDRDIDYWKKKRELLLSELKAGLTSITIAVLGARVWTIDRLLAQLRDTEEQYLLARAEACLVVEAKKVAKALAETIASQRTVFEDFLSAITSLHREFEQRHTSFLASRPHAFFIRLFDKDTDWERFYWLGVNENKEPQPVNPVKEYNDFVRKTLGGNARLLELVQVFQRESASYVDQNLRQYTEMRFWDDFKQNPRQVRVLDHPWLKDSRRRQEIVQRMVRSARPLLRQTTLPGAETTVVRRAYLGICDPNVEPYRSFIKLVEKELDGINGPKYALELIPTGQPAEIYLYFSNYAFALPALPIIYEECHSAYTTFYAKLADQEGGDQTSIPLHLSTRWEGRFDDLVILSSEEARRLHEIRRILLFGTILKVLVLREGKGNLEYHYKVGPPFNKMIHLGSWRRAITILSRKDGMRSTLLNAIQQREKGLPLQLRISYYWALQGLLYNPEMTPVMPEYYILEDKLKDIYEELIAGGADPEKLNLTVPEEERLDYLKNLPDSGLDWSVGGYPCIRDLEIWAFPGTSRELTASDNSIWM
jgi:hypothetical protein